MSIKQYHYTHNAQTYSPLGIPEMLTGRRCRYFKKDFPCDIISDAEMNIRRRAKQHIDPFNLGKFSMIFFYRFVEGIATFTYTNICQKKKQNKKTNRVVVVFILFLSFKRMFRMCGCVNKAWTRNFGSLRNIAARKTEKYWKKKILFSSCLSNMQYIIISNSYRVAVSLIIRNGGVFWAVTAGRATAAALFNCDPNWCDLTLRSWHTKLDAR